MNRTLIIVGIVLMAKAILIYWIIHRMQTKRKKQVIGKLSMVIDQLSLDARHHGDEHSMERLKTVADQMKRFHIDPEDLGMDNEKAIARLAYRAFRRYVAHHRCMQAQIVKQQQDNPTLCASLKDHLATLKSELQIWSKWLASSFA